MAELRRLAKFGQNRLNRGRDMTIFRFFKMAAATILDFSNFIFLTVGQLKRVEMRRHAKFGQNRSKRGRDMAIFRFSKLAVAASLKNRKIAISRPRFDRFRPNLAG